MNLTRAVKARAVPSPGTAAAVVALGAAILIAGCGGSSNSGSSSSASTPSTPATSPATTASASSTPATTSSTATSTSTSTTSASATPLALEANKEGQLAYSTKSLTASSENVAIDFTNNSPLGHNVTIESSSGQTEGATPTFQGGTKTLSLHLKPGVYKFFCSVPGHRMAGMEGTLTVK